MATYTLEQIDAKIAELEAEEEELARLPDSGSVGATSYSGTGRTLQSVRQLLDTWRRRRRTYLNGGLPLPKRRCC